MNKFEREYAEKRNIQKDNKNKIEKKKYVFVY